MIADEEIQQHYNERLRNPGGKVKSPPGELDT